MRAAPGARVAKRTTGLPPRLARALLSLGYAAINAVRSRLRGTAREHGLHTEGGRR